MSDLDTIIEDAITDTELPLETPDIDTAASDDLPEASPEPTTTDSPDPLPEGDLTSEVQSPAARASDPVKVDDFEKRFGIAQNSSSGRENRIPYSRVKKITDKAEKDTDTRIRAEYAPKLTEFETKVKDYETRLVDQESRLQNVAKIEHMMVNDHVGFLQTLIDKVPGYAQILAPLYQQTQAPATTAQPAAPATADPTFPQPDVDLPDGTKVYSMDGLDKLNRWNREQARQEAVKEIDQKYGKVLESYQLYERQRELSVKVDAQITEAMKWPQFQENEKAITAALQANPRLSLEGAYRQVVVPSLTAAQTTAKVDQAKLEQEIRTKILAELKQTPRSTSATAGATKPGSRPSTAGPRSIEAIIEEQIKTLKG